MVSVENVFCMLFSSVTTKDIVISLLESVYDGVKEETLSQSI